VVLVGATGRVPERLRAAVVAGAVAALLVACGGPPPAAPRSAPTSTAEITPTPGTRHQHTGDPHVMLIVLQTREVSDLAGSAAAPRINQLAQRYGTATHAYATAHPELLDYMELFTGTTGGFSTDCATCDIGYAPTFIDQIAKRSVGWRAFMDGLPQACDTRAVVGSYVRLHNPFAYSNQLRLTPSNCQRVVPLWLLGTDLEANSVPAFVWISPDLCDGGTVCSTAASDHWLAGIVDEVQHSAWYRDDGVIIVTWDQGTTTAGCCNRAAGGHIPLIVISDTLRSGTHVDTPVDQAGILRSLEDVYRVPHLGDAACACSGSIAPLLAPYTAHG